ncbi:MAG: isoprenyl transferase [Candidatus Omnitrophica bacterium]|nr:isoprenyl transferase [Candidatus Omnitrophota bacterium]
MKRENLEWAVENKGRLPRHIAIIMDGNGRWAKNRGLPRNAGHKAGIDRIKTTSEAAAECGIKALTFFAFSTENWSRPKSEVGALMKMMERYLKTQLGYLMKNNVRFSVIGRRDPLPPGLIDTISRTVKATQGNSGIMVNIALNYGSRAEIVDAVKKIARMYKMDKLKDGDIDEDTVSSFLYTKGLPDPDLLIRTSGEMRISNFLLWQLSYAELYFTETYWPDFGEDEFTRALKAFSGRQRRYGGV